MSLLSEKPCLVAMPINFLSKFFFSDNCFAELLYNLKTMSSERHIETSSDLLLIMLSDDVVI